MMIGAGTTGLVLGRIDHESLGQVETLTFRLERDAPDPSGDLPYAGLDVRQGKGGGDLYVYIDGVSRDETGNKALFRESGEPFGQWVVVGGALIKRYGAGWDHHAAVAYRVDTAQPVCWGIQVFPDPLRVVVRVSRDCDRCTAAGVTAPAAPVDTQ